MIVAELLSAVVRLGGGIVALAESCRATYIMSIAFPHEHEIGADSLLAAMRLKGYI